MLQRQTSDQKMQLQEVKPSHRGLSISEEENKSGAQNLSNLSRSHKAVTISSQQRPPSKLSRCARF